MNILFITIAWPDFGDRNLYSDLMEEFSINGANVYILSADDKVSNHSLTIENGIKVLRVSTFKVRKVNKIRKALALFSMGRKLENALFKYWPEIHLDLIISHSPPVTFWKLFKSLKRRFNIPIYYLLKDIWPQGPVDLKLIRKPGIIYAFFRSQEIKTYKTVDYIGCMSPMNKEYLLRHNNFLSAEKVEVCQNSIRPRHLKLNEEREVVRSKYNIPKDSVVFIFSGNIGKAHGLDFYLDAIEALKNFNKAYFLIGGSGQYYNFVVREISKRGLSNIATYRRLPSEDFDQLIQACDVGVILLDKAYSVPQFPSRLLAYLEAKIPILCSVNRDTDIGTIIEKAGCGITTLHGDINSFVHAVEYFCNRKNSDATSGMSANSHNLLMKEYTCNTSYKTITGRIGMKPEQVK